MRDKGWRLDLPAPTVLALLPCWSLAEEDHRYYHHLHGWDIGSCGHCPCPESLHSFLGLLGSWGKVRFRDSGGYIRRGTIASLAASGWPRAREWKPKEADLGLISTAVQVIPKCSRALAGEQQCHSG